ncbi:MAG: hypothetical protein DRH12_03865 [Deltaproteobacteria bacterium]|nr:MAG: hypothetical protein DRH12_03865 [Deltaproteobacteria bacterium]
MDRLSRENAGHGAEPGNTGGTCLGGFKILWDCAHFSLFYENAQDPEYVLDICSTLSESQLNLPFFTFGLDQRGQYLGITVESNAAPRAQEILHNFSAQSDKAFLKAHKSSILSIFPHRNRPEIAASLLHAFSESKIQPAAMANSSAAISAVIDRGLAPQAAQALFGPFCFNTYRTPEDWKLAQKGKEKIYKEIIASYQEKRPKVYSLNWDLDLDLFEVWSPSDGLGSFAELIRRLDRAEVNLAFLVSFAVGVNQEHKFFLAFPHAKLDTVQEDLRHLTSCRIILRPRTVSVFSMNGPHFGDRYGIAALLFRCFYEALIRPIAVGCTVASIMGLVESDRVKAATEAIKASFDVPAVMEKQH